MLGFGNTTEQFKAASDKAGRLMEQGRYPDAVPHLKKCLRLLPKIIDQHGPQLKLLEVWITLWYSLGTCSLYVEGEERTQLAVEVMNIQNVIADVLLKLIGRAQEIGTPEAKAELDRILHVFLDNMTSLGRAWHGAAILAAERFNQITASIDRTRKAMTAPAAGPSRKDQIMDGLLHIAHHFKH
jgi:tetratricopeptide (TPR) repeat protein